MESRVRVEADGGEHRMRMRGKHGGSYGVVVIEGIIRREGRDSAAAAED